jgi:hypothetical protein
VSGMTARQLDKIAFQFSSRNPVKLAGFTAGIVPARAPETKETDATRDSFATIQTSPLRFVNATTQLHCGRKFDIP